MTTPRPLPYTTFLQSFRLCPRLAVSLCVVDSSGTIVLAKRSIPPKPGAWHLPGSFLLTGESLDACITRILLRECGIRRSRRHRIHCAGPFENLAGDPRGHIVDLIYVVHLTANDTPKAGKGLDALRACHALPRGIAFGHRAIIRAVWTRPTPAPRASRRSS